MFTNSTVGNICSVFHRKNGVRVCMFTCMYMHVRVHISRPKYSCVYKRCMKEHTQKTSIYMPHICMSVCPWADPGGESGHAHAMQLGYRLWPPLQWRNKRERLRNILNCSPFCRMSGSATVSANTWMLACLPLWYQRSLKKLTYEDAMVVRRRIVAKSLFWHLTLSVTGRVTLTER